MDSCKFFPGCFMKWIIVVMALLSVNQACAGVDKSHASGQTIWEKECGSCHLAYPPRFLNLASWQRLMAGLDRHFGDNAELAPEERRVILEFLSRNAGAGVRRDAASSRISDTLWFKHAHDEVPKGAWADPLVKSKANCAACHVNASRGDWSERGVVMPPGWGEEEDDDDRD